MTSRSEIARDNKAITVDSLRYWITSVLLLAPTAFFIPTSLTLLEARAVDKFMKLIQAMRRMKTAMMEKSLTYSILPPACFPFSYFP